MSGLNRVLNAGLLVLFVVAGCVPPPSSKSGVPRLPTAAEKADDTADDDPDSGPDSDTEPGQDGPDAETEFTETATGLKYRILRKGTGPKPLATDRVSVHYRGTLDDGSEFDSSYSRGKPAAFGLNGVIAGWTQGLQLIGVGGKIELEIPYQLAYGEEGRPGSIPPKATLHFIVELLSIK